MITWKYWIGVRYTLYYTKDLIEFDLEDTLESLAYFDTSAAFHMLAIL